MSGTKVVDDIKFADGLFNIHGQELGLMTSVQDFPINPGVHTDGIFGLSLFGKWEGKSKKTDNEMGVSVLSNMLQVINKQDNKQGEDDGDNIEPKFWFEKFKGVGTRGYSQTLYG